MPDRGQAHGPRDDGVIIDLSRASAEALYLVREGRTCVRREVVPVRSLRGGSSIREARDLQRKRSGILGSEDRFAYNSPDVRSNNPSLINVPRTRTQTSSRRLNRRIAWESDNFWPGISLNSAATRRSSCSRAPGLRRSSSDWEAPGSGAGLSASDDAPGPFCGVVIRTSPGSTLRRDKQARLAAVRRRRRKL